MKKLPSIVIALFIGLMLIITISAFSSLTNAETTPTIWTDKPDYVPESLVTIYGTQFNPLTNITVTIQRPDLVNDTVLAVTDSAGNFTCTYQLDSLSGSYVATATDGMNTAVTTFTDPPATPTTTTLNTLSNPLMAGKSYKFNGTVSATPSVPNGYEIDLQCSTDGQWGAAHLAFTVVVHTSGGTGYFNGTFIAPSTIGTYYFRAHFPPQNPWQVSDSAVQTIAVNQGYLLSVVTSPLSIDSTTGSGWYFSGTIVSISAPPNVDIVAGSSRYHFTNWSGTGIANSSSASTTVTMGSANKTVTANYVIQYKMTFTASDNILEDSNTTIVTVDGANKTASDLPFTTDWKTSGVDSISYSYETTVTSKSSPSNTKYGWLWAYGLGQESLPQSDTFTVSTNGTITSDYATTFKVTFTASSNVLDDASPTAILRIGKKYPVFVSLPYTVWVPYGNQIPFSYETIVASSSSPSDTRYVWASTTGLSTAQSDDMIVTGPGTVTGNYNTQYEWTFYETGLTSDAAGTILTLGSTNCTYADFTSGVLTVWASDGEAFNWTTIVPGNIGERFITALNSGTINNASSGSLADYFQQWQVTFSQTGVTSDADGNTVLTVGTTNYAYNDMPSGWFTNGTTFIWSPTVAGVSNERFIVGDQAGISPITAAGTFEASYMQQWKVTFIVNGLDTDANGLTVLTVGSMNYSYNNNSTIVSDWFNNATTYSWTSPVTVTTDVEQFITSAASGSISAPGTISTTFIKQWHIQASYSTSDGSTPSADVILRGTQAGNTSFTLTLATSTQGVWLDAGKKWSVNIEIPTSPTTERWYAKSGALGTVGSSTVIAPMYYHMYMITFGYGDQDHVAFPISVKIGSYNQTGSSKNINASTSYGLTIPFADWVDAGDRQVIYQTFTNIAGTMRWALQSSPVKMNVATSGTLAETEYFHQFSIIFIYDIYDGSNPTGPLAYYTQFNQNKTISPAYDDDTVTDWVDGKTNIYFDNPLGVSSSNERWQANLAISSNKSKVVNSVNGPVFAGATYYHQYKITFSYIDQDVSTITPGVKIGYYMQFGSAKNINASTSYGTTAPGSAFVDIGFNGVSFITYENNGQRWGLIDPDHIEVDTYGTITETGYYHQYLITFSYSTQDSSLITSGATIGSYTQFGYPRDIKVNTPYHYTTPSSDWVDAGNSTVSYQTYMAISGTERWYLSTSPDNRNVTSSTTITEDDYNHQWQVSFTVTPVSAGTTSPTGTDMWENAGSLAINATAITGYHFVNWASNTASITLTSMSSASTTATISGNGTITANFAINTYTITVIQGTNGNISPSTTTVNYNDNATFTITPDTGYHTTDVIVDGASQGAMASYTFIFITADHNITATFAINTYTITVIQGAHGAISPGTTVVNYGANATFTVTPDTGYHTTDAIVDGVSQGVLTSYTFGNVTNSHNMTASFAINTYYVYVGVGLHGSSNQSSTTVDWGSTLGFLFTPDTGYHVQTVTVNGTSQGAITTLKLLIEGNTNMTVSFAINTYTITVIPGANGNIAPGTTTINYGATPTFNITANTGYHILNVLVDGSSVGAESSYTFPPVNANHNITASFAVNPPSATLTSLVTDADLHYFDVNSSRAGQQFRLIFTPDSTGYKLSASNPGQFSYNIFYQGTAGTPVSFSISIPYPFVTQGAVPMHVYSQVIVGPGPSYIPSGQLSGFSINPSTITLSASPATITINGTVPSSGVIYITIHLNYGLKQTSGYSQRAGNNAIGTSYNITNHTDYSFSVTNGFTTSSTTLQNENVFKRDPGFAGLVIDSSGTPKQGVRVDIYGPGGKLLATVYTDVDGWYMYSYKYTGKAATFTIKLPTYNKQQSVTLKANSFARLDFTV